MKLKQVKMRWIKHEIEKCLMKFSKLQHKYSGYYEYYKYINARKCIQNEVNNLAKIKEKIK